MSPVPHGELRFRSQTKTGDAGLAGRRLWLAALGAVAATGEAGRELIAALADRGARLQEKRRSQASRVRNDLVQRIARLRCAIEAAPDSIASALARRAGLPHRDDVAALTERIDTLQQALDNLAEEA